MTASPASLPRATALQVLSCNVWPAELLDQSPCSGYCDRFRGSVDPATVPGVGLRLYVVLPLAAAESTAQCRARVDGGTVDLGCSRRWVSTDQTKPKSDVIASEFYRYVYLKKNACCSPDQS